MKSVHFTSISTDVETSASTFILAANETSNIKRLSASCQQVVTENITKCSAHLIVRSCLADTQLYPAVAGHKCNHVPLVSSGLEADMAMTVSIHIWKSIYGEKASLPGLNVCNMEVPKPYIAQIPQRSPGQYIEIEANADLDDDSRLTKVRCEVRSVQPSGTAIETHATCTVKFEDVQAWKEEWAKYTHLILTQIKDLHRRNDTGHSHRMQRGLAYKVFQHFVNYDDKYRGMDEVVFEGLEGTSSVTFQTERGDYCGPFHLDNSCHLSGFLCNASDSESDANVFVSEGWDACKFSDLTLLTEAGGRLTNYTLMQEKKKGVLQGDVYVLQEGEIVAMWEGVRFKRLPKRVVDVFLPRPKKR